MNHYQQQEDQFHIDYLEQTMNSYNWKDIDDFLATLPENNYYQVQIPDKSTQMYYLRFRYILQHQHTHLLPATLALCTFLIKSSTNNYYALMLRKKIINHQINHLISNDEKEKRALLQRELKFMNNLLQDNPKEYHVWTYKKDLISSIVFKQEREQQKQKAQQTLLNTIIKDQIYSSENKFIFKLLIQDCRNYHAWDYRFWLVTFLGKIDEELKLVDELITYHSGMRPLIEQEETQRGKLSITQMKINWIQVNSLWSHKFNLIRYMKQHHTKTTINQLILEQLKQTIHLLQQNKKNQPLWNYLSGLIQIIQKQYQQSSHIVQFNQIIQHNLALLLDHTQIEILQICHMNRFQLNFLKKHIEYFNLSNQNQKILYHKILNQLKTVDNTREKYYDYLIKRKNSY